MKTQSETGLVFTKRALAKLNDNPFHDVNGGTTPVCVGVIIGLTMSIAIDKALS